MSALQSFKPITCFVFDVDGVLTDGMLLVFDSGEQVRRMNIKDGYALQLAIARGYRVVVISGAKADAVSMRLNKLGVTDVFMQVEDKKKQLEEYMQEHNLKWEEILFMGDDMPDYELMQCAGLPCAPNDAVPAVRHIAKYISTCGGGGGCVRDVIEKVMKLNDHWEPDLRIASK